MKILTELFTLFSAEMTEPASFGPFHFACVGVMLLLTAITCKAFKNCSDETLRRITAFVWIIVLTLEVYKHLIFGFEIEDGRFVWDYPWYIFPFQFCSSPLYILPIIAFSKREGLRTACIAYMMTFSLFAGLAVFCYPNDVFVETIGINIQTMVHHGSQILMGAFYAVRYRKRFSPKFFMGGVAVFCVMVAIAYALNISAYHIFPYFGIDETFNMFYISPYFECTLPLLSIIYGIVPYPVFACIYIFGFVLCALIVYTLARVLVSHVKDENKAVRLGNANRYATRRVC